MKKITLSARLAGRIEYCWLLLTNPTFQAARDKRLAFYQYQVGKYYSPDLLAIALSIVPITPKTESQTGPAGHQPR